MRRRYICKPFVTPDKEAEALVQEIQQLSEWYVEEQKTTLARLEVKMSVMGCFTNHRSFV